MTALDAEQRLTKNARPQRFRTIDCLLACNATSSLQDFNVLSGIAENNKICKQKDTTRVGCAHLSWPNCVESLKPPDWRRPSSTKLFRPGRIRSSKTSLLRARSKMQAQARQRNFLTSSFWSISWKCSRRCQHSRWKSIVRNRGGLAFLFKRCSASRAVIITHPYAVKTLLWRKWWSWQGSSNQAKTSHFFNKNRLFAFRESWQIDDQKPQNNLFWAKICCAQRKTMLLFGPLLIFQFRQKMGNFTNPTLKNGSKFTKYFWVFKKISTFCDFEPESKNED